jgi:6-phosphogluconate dehydrogenase
VGFDPNRQTRGTLQAEGLTVAASLAELIGGLVPPRIVFVYVPAGETTEAVVRSLGGLLEPGDVVTDGGNSHWEDSKRLAGPPLRFLDCGTSGGVGGARQGACFMVGGERATYDHHNMIEFGMVQAIGEGVELLGRSEYALELPALFRLWNHGSIIRGLLVELMERGLRKHPNLADVSPYTNEYGGHPLYEPGSEPG